MKKEELEKALDLQQRAYGLLLWTARQAACFLDQEALSSTGPCLQWLNRHWNELPAEFRPEWSDLDSFSKMLASFFNTSFHLEGHGCSARLARGRKFKDRRNRKHAQGRAAEAASELSRAAVASLARSEGTPAENEVISAILKDDALAEAVNLWAYGCELVRRSQFASQGPAVHHLWLELNEKKRKRLNPEEIWKARRVLIEAARRKAAGYEQQ